MSYITRLLHSALGRTQGPELQPVSSVRATIAMVPSFCSRCERHPTCERLNKPRSALHNRCCADSACIKTVNSL